MAAVNRVEEAVAIRVMDEMVGQQPGRLIRIGGAGPPGGEMAHRGGDRRLPSRRILRRRASR